MHNTPHINSNHNPSPTIRTLDAELEAVLLSKAAQFGLPPEWVSRLDALDPERRQVLRVRGTVARSPAAEVLSGGDMVLQINGRPVTCFRDVDDAIAAACAAAAAGGARRGGGGGAESDGDDGDSDAEDGGGGGGGGSAAVAPRAAKRRRRAQQGANGVAAAMDVDGGGGAKQEDEQQQQDGHQQDEHQQQPAPPPPPLPEVTLTIFDRSRAIRDVRVRLQQECGMGTSRLVHWAGAQLQAPHRAVREGGFLPPGGAGVYVSRWFHGSSAHRYGLYALHTILEVNGRPTPDLDAFLEVVAPLKDGDFARVKVCHMETTQVKVSG